MVSIAPAPRFDVDLLLKGVPSRRYRAKSTIIRSGEWGESVYFLVRGSVSVVIQDREERDLVLAYLNSGDFFGEMGLFGSLLGDRGRSAMVVARTECTVAEISYRRFLELAVQNPEVFYALGSQMADRLRKTTRKAGDLFFLDITGRVAKALGELCKQPGATHLPEGIQIRITRQELARIVGCSREMAGRVLKSLSEQGHLYLQGRTVLVYFDRQAAPQA